MRSPHCHTRPLPELTRVLSLNTPREAHSFIHSFIHSPLVFALVGTLLIRLAELACFGYDFHAGGHRFVLIGPEHLLYCLCVVMLQSNVLPVCCTASTQSVLHVCDSASTHSLLPVCCTACLLLLLPTGCPSSCQQAARRRVTRPRGAQRNRRMPARFPLVQQPQARRDRGRLRA
jgi:hypothetical protein